LQLRLLDFIHLLYHWLHDQLQHGGERVVFCSSFKNFGFNFLC
jgi:hypothetical protein